MNGPWEPCYFRQFQQAAGHDTRVLVFAVFWSFTVNGIEFVKLNRY